MSRDQGKSLLEKVKAYLRFSGVSNTAISDMYINQGTVIIEYNHEILSTSIPLPFDIDQVKTELEIYDYDDDGWGSIVNYPSVYPNIGNLAKLIIYTEFVSMQRLMHKSISTFSNLEILKLMGNSKKDKKIIPNTFSQLKNLKELLLSCKTNLTSQEFDILCELSNLEVLTLFSFQFPSDTDFSKFDNLLEIKLRNCSLRSIPTSLFELKKLEKLKLPFNSLQKLDQKISLLSNLKILDLSNNDLKKLPESICKLKDLKQLDLSENSISKLPSSFTKLSLEKLDLSNNKISKLPQDIGQMEQIEELHLSNNNLKTLPENIGTLQNLKFLDLSNNQLQTLPESIKNIDNLEINLIGNTNIRDPRIDRSDEFLDSIGEIYS